MVSFLSQKRTFSRGTPCTLKQRGHKEEKHHYKELFVYNKLRKSDLKIKRSQAIKLNIEEAWGKRRGKGDIISLGKRGKGKKKKKNTIFQRF